MARVRLPGDIPHCRPQVPVDIFLPQRRVFLMHSLNPLVQLRRLDRSSSEFHEQLNEVLRGEGYKQWVPNLDGDGLVGLVDYLDNVCHRTALVRSPLKPA
jgi:hypothetical protein